MAEQRFNADGLTDFLRRRFIQLLAARGSFGVFDLLESQFHAGQQHLLLEFHGEAWCSISNAFRAPGSQFIPSTADSESSGASKKSLSLGNLHRHGVRRCMRSHGGVLPHVRVGGARLAVPGGSCWILGGRRLRND